MIQAYVEIGSLYTKILLDNSTVVTMATTRDHSKNTILLYINLELFIDINVSIDTSPLLYKFYQLVYFSISCVDPTIVIPITNILVI